MLIQSLGFLIMCKITNDIFYIVIEKMRTTSAKETDIFNKDFAEWKEIVFGIILLLTTANDIVLGLIFSRQEYFVQATFTLVVFIGFFVPLKSILCGRCFIKLLMDKKILNDIYKKWIKGKGRAIFMLILFFVVADILLVREIRIIEIGLAVLAFSIGIILVIIFWEKRIKHTVPKDDKGNND